MVTHGLDATYKKGCRCQPCKTAQSIANCEKRMTLTGKPPTPGHSRRIIAETCRRCGNLTTADRIQHACPPQRKGPAPTSTMSTWRGRGGNRQWRSIRASVLDRDRQTCRLILTGCTTVATHAHHVLGRDITGDDPAYLIATCPPCNVRAGHPGMVVELIHLRTHLDRLATNQTCTIEPGPAPAYGSSEAKALVRRWVDEHGLSIAHIEETPTPS
jgi:5-methylcytosine-specific restriction endonuclease McrA